jgi:hypothetical protein
MMVVGDENSHRVLAWRNSEAIFHSKRTIRPIGASPFTLEQDHQNGGLVQYELAA